jgi:hypothetical protein
MINNIVQLLFIMVLLPFSHSLNTPGVLYKSSTASYSKKLTQAYALYTAIINEYKNKWETIEHLHKQPEKLHKTFHAMVLTSQNESGDSSLLLNNKKNKPYQELPYLYFKKNLDTAKKTIINHLETVQTQNVTEQSAISHCLHHVLTKIESLDTFIITTPEYYQEQVKIASVNKQTPLMLQILQASLGFIAKKFVPLF